MGKPIDKESKALKRDFKKNLNMDLPVTVEEDLWGVDPEGYYVHVDTTERTELGSTFKDKVSKIGNISKFKKFFKD